jgi:DNA-directed RNA polymerase specialized sigma24 family protein
VGAWEETRRQKKRHAPPPAAVDFVSENASHQQLLEHLAQDAEDIVQDACLAVLEGDLAISPDPVQAFDDLHAAVARRAIAHRRRHGGQG